MTVVSNCSNYTVNYLICDMWFDNEQKCQANFPFIVSVLPALMDTWWNENFRWVGVFFFICISC